MDNSSMPIITNEIMKILILMNQFFTGHKGF